MLIALITILILGGSSTGMLDYIADTQDNVKVVMQKDDRRKEAVGTLKAMKKRANAHNKMVKGVSKDMKKILPSEEVTDTDRSCDRTPGRRRDGSPPRLFAVRRQFFRSSDLRGWVVDLPRGGCTCRRHSRSEGRSNSAGRGASKHVVLVRPWLITCSERSPRANRATW